MSGADRASGFWPRALGAVLAVSLGLMCAALAYHASTARMNDMAGMAGGVAPAVASPAMAFSASSTYGAALAPVVVPSISVYHGPAAMCAGGCVAAVSDACGLAAGLTVTPMLLLLTSRRNTFIGLLARVRQSYFARRRRRLRTPWTVLSPFALCVLRV